MVNLAQAWAEAYSKAHPNISVEVSGGGSGVGIAALINGTADIANASRQLEPAEVEKATKQAGKHPANESWSASTGSPSTCTRTTRSTEISMEELSEIYKEGGKINKWSRPRRERDSRRPRRRNRARQPPEQLRHLPLFPRARGRQKERLQAGLAGHERLEGRGRAGRQARRARSATAASATPPPP